MLSRSDAERILRRHTSGMKAMRRRNILKGVVAVGVSSVVARSHGYEKSSVKILMPENPEFPDIKKFNIHRPGSYVFDQDYIQKSRMQVRGGWMKPTGGGMINILCGSISLSLGGCKIGADLNMSGIILRPAANATFAKKWPEEYAPASLDSRFVKITDGTIDLARGEATGVGVDFSSRWSGVNQRTSGRPIIGRNDPHVEYERNEYTFKRLKVLANSIGLAAEGSYAVIRDCIIESADLAAIFIAGDHVLIENCEIRLRRYQKKRKELRAAIVLRDGSHAIIRNNIIRVDDDGDGETYGILVRDRASNITIENNTFVNTREKAIMLADDSTAVVQKNKYERRWL